MQRGRLLTKLTHSRPTVSRSLDIRHNDSAVYMRELTVTTGAPKAIVFTCAFHSRTTIRSSLNGLGRSRHAISMNLNSKSIIIARVTESCLQEAVEPCSLDQMPDVSFSAPQFALLQSYLFIPDGVGNGM